MKSEREVRVFANDSVATLAVRNGDMAKTLNTLRTVPGAPNPFVSSAQRNGKLPTQSNSHATSEGSSPAK